MIQVNNKIQLSTLSMRSIKIQLGRPVLRLNIVALSILFVGYALTIGTGFITNPSAIAIFRLIALAMFLVLIAIGRTINAIYLFVLVALAVILIVNQSTFGQNIVFLIIMSLSLARLRSNEIAIAFLIPILLVIVIHQAFLNTAAISSLSTEFGNRLRSTYGFTNANQASSIYLSFVITSFLAHSEFRSRVTFYLWEPLLD